MAQGGTGPRYIGDYVVKEKIGSGSFSVVWRASHKIHGGEVAIKEIVTEKLSRKLQQSLVSEVTILKNINHPNIIRLHEFHPMPDRLCVVLEYCTGGDLSAYIQQHGRVSEAIAAHFMRQLAAGLQVLRRNDLIHRDLKPQNLLLSASDSNAVLKIADFGFARSLQPQGLAETLCGSPLYMAPEIMQFQKYDAKADLWSVGAILYQLVTGQTPFSGNSQLQLLQNIVRSNELRFPPEVGDLHPHCIDLCKKLLRRNPVERLSFEEFFNHEFLVQTKLDSSPKLIREHKDALNSNSPVLGGTPSSDTGESSHEDCLTFILDDDLHGHVGSTPFIVSHSSGFPESSEVAGRSPFSMNSSVGKKLYAGNAEIDFKQQFTGPSQALQIQRQSEIGLFKPPLVDVEQEICNTPLPTVLDSLESIEQEYVLVPDTSTELSSSLHSPSGLVQLPGKVLGSSIRKLEKNPVVSAPMPIVGAALGSAGCVGSFGSHSSIPSGTSQGSIDSGDVSDQPSVHPPTRLRSLQQCAQAVTELVNNMLVERKHLEALSIHLVCLAIWKEALHICHTWAASATEGSPSQDGIGSGDVLNKKRSAETADMSEEAHLQEAAAACSQMEDGFLLAVERADELGDYLEQLDASAEMPDAMEMIFQGALVSGRRGAVEELMGNMEKAVNMYSKSTKLLYFLLVEAPCLTLNPPFLLSSSDRNRLHRYIDILTTREIQSRAHSGVLQESEGQQSI